MQFVGLFEGVPGDTFKQTSTDTATGLTAASLLSDSGNRCIGILIYCEAQGVRFGFGDCTLAQGVTGLGHVIDDGEWMYIRSSAAIKSMKIISHINGAHGTLSITPFFEPGR